MHFRWSFHRNAFNTIVKLLNICCLQNIFFRNGYRTELIKISKIETNSTTENYIQGKTTNIW